MRYRSHDERLKGVFASRDFRLSPLRSFNCRIATGRSTIAVGLRKPFGRDLANVAQDNLRRTILPERDVPGGGCRRSIRA
ncbi:hypothetical protein ABZV31_07860 [Streptomyces sp. NPDC005202]|uniref:hypothetical protein n=1 Tax=Streptomyces sp. NPDC005202 TaxID=3157021 RepID=UPI0033A2E0C5